MSLLFIFDMDDVLYDYDWRVRMSAMTEITGLPLDELRRRWWHNDGEWAAEAGGFASAAEYLSAFEKAIGMPKLKATPSTACGMASTRLA